jgi:hypothetical protein
MGRIEQVEHGASQGEQRKGTHASWLGPLVRIKLLEREPKKQRQTQKKRQIGKQWQRSSKRQGAPLRNISIGLQPQPDKTACMPNSLPIADDRDPMDPAKPLGHLGK